MEVLLPARRKRLQCLDNFQSDSIEAFEYLNKYVVELGELGKIDSVTRSDLLRRSRVASNFVAYEQRVHMEKESETVNHCLRYLLSDPNNKEFANPCNRGKNAHVHNLVCTECLECTNVFDVFIEIVKKALSESNKANNRTDSIRFARMLEQMEISKKNVTDYRLHQIRAFASEMNRKEIIENLQPGQAFVVLDFALKIIPTGSIETQSEWFGKAGISYHMAYCVVNLNGTLHHHSFAHPADDMKQDGMSASGITEHVLTQLKENGVKQVFLRSDNAGTYHNAQFLSTLFHFQQTIGVRILAYVFSESQAGKGDADREISHHKRIIRSHVDSKGNARNAKEIVQAMKAGTLLKATSIHEIEITPIHVSSSSFPGIASFGSFHFEASEREFILRMFSLQAEGIRARKYENIGVGVLIGKKKIVKNTFKKDIGLEGGYLSKSDGFWKEFDCEEDKAVDDSDKSEDTSPTPKGGIFTCPDRLCTAEFLTLNGLGKHKLLGKHRRRKGSESTIDRGVRMWADAVESDPAAARSVKSDSLVSIVQRHKQLPEQGWAMRRRENAPSITQELIEVVKEYFDERRGAGRRALAREICPMIKEMKKTNGEYRFPLILCPKESQCQTQINNLLKEERQSVNSQKPKASKRSRVTYAQNQSESDDSDNQPSTSQAARKSVAKKASHASCNASQLILQATKRKRTVAVKKSSLREEKQPVFEDDDEIAEFMEELDDHDSEFSFSD